MHYIKFSSLNRRLETFSKFLLIFLLTFYNSLPLISSSSLIPTNNSHKSQIFSSLLTQPKTLQENKNVEKVVERQVLKNDTFFGVELGSVESLEVPLNPAVSSQNNYDDNYEEENLSKNTTEDELKFNETKNKRGLILIIRLAQCRANCLQKFGASGDEEGGSESKEGSQKVDLSECWRTCLKIEEESEVGEITNVDNEKKRAPACSSQSSSFLHYCLKGCQEACEWHKSESGEKREKNEKILLPVSPLIFIKNDSNSCSLQWEKISNPSLVLILIHHLKTNENDLPIWQVIGKKTLKNSHTSAKISCQESNTDFRLLVISAQGIEKIYSTLIKQFGINKAFGRSKVENIDFSSKFQTNDELQGEYFPKIQNNSLNSSQNENYNQSKIYSENSNRSKITNIDLAKNVSSNLPKHYDFKSSKNQTFDSIKEKSFDLAENETSKRSKHLDALKNERNEVLKNESSDWSLSLNSLVHQKYLVLGEVRWRYLGVKNGKERKFLVTWEVYGGIIKGNLVTESNVITLSLWPDTFYSLQVALINTTGMDSNSLSQLEQILSTTASLPLISSSQKIFVNTSGAPYPLLPPQNYAKNTPKNVLKSKIPNLNKNVNNFINITKSTNVSKSEQLILNSAQNRQSGKNVQNKVVEPILPEYNSVLKTTRYLHNVRKSHLLINTTGVQKSDFQTFENDSESELYLPDILLHNNISEEESNYNNSDLCHWAKKEGTPSEREACILIWTTLAACFFLILLLFLYFTYSIYSAVDREEEYKKLHSICSVAHIYDQKLYKFHKKYFKSPEFRDYAWRKTIDRELGLNLNSSDDDDSDDDDVEDEGIAED